MYKKLSGLLAILFIAILILLNLSAICAGSLKYDPPSGRIFVLSVGINDYPEPLFSFLNCESDAIMVADSIIMKYISSLLEVKYAIDSLEKSGES